MVAADYPDLTIVAQNDAHVKVSYVKRGEVLGRKLLDAYPDTSEEYVKTGRSSLVESMRSVIETGKPDTMPDLKYDLKDESGKWIVKYWKVTHNPVFKDGKVVAVYQETKDTTEEKKIKQELEKTTYELDKVLETSKVGTWKLDLEKNHVVADRNLANMFGVSFKSAQAGLPLETFIKSIHTTDRERVQQQIDAALKNGTLYECEYRMKSPSDSETWVLARGTVEYDDNQKPSVFSGTLIDITDRKLAEHEVTESENRLRFMADSMPQLVWVTRPDGYHEYYNQRWYDYTGTKPGTTDGDGWNDLFHTADQARAKKQWNHSLKTGEPYEIEYRLYHAPTKSYRWVIGRAMPLRDENGQITKWYGTCTDINDQKRSADYQSFLADVSKELMSSFDIHKMLTKIAKLSVPTIADWCAVELYSEEGGFEQVAIAHTDKEKISLVREYRQHNPLHKDDETGIPKMLRTGEAEFTPVITPEMIEAVIDDPETLEFMKNLNLCSMMVVPLKEGNKTIGGFSFAASDSQQHFTELDFKMAQELGVRVSLSLTNASLYAESVNDLKRRRELEQQLRTEKDLLESRVQERTTQLSQTNEGLREEIIRRQSAEQELGEYSDELTRSNKELEDFAYVASHDLQEPLRKIQAFGNLLKSEYGDALGEEGADYLQRMHSAASRMSTLIEDLLVFSRITRKAPDTRNIDLNIMLKDVVSDLETRIKDTDGTVTVGNLPIVMADATHMRQLFQNLVGNALKFHKPDVPPVVTIESRVKKNGYEITVTDNGIGFDEKYLDRIFSVFQRLHERSSYEGTGIGLAVCRKIVERYDGIITAVSTKGEGSKFIIWLPNANVKKGKK